MIFGQKIKKLRKSRGLNQNQLAEEINVHKNTISNWERAKHPVGEVEKLLRLAAYFEVDFSWLISADSDSDPMPPKANASDEKRHDLKESSTSLHLEQNPGELYFKAGDNEVRLPDTPSSQELFVTIVSKILEANQPSSGLKEEAPDTPPASAGVSQTA